MAKKKSGGESDRSDPAKNKSLAIRTVLKSMGSSKASEIVAAVKKEYGHDVPQSMVYMVKAKTNMAKSNKRGRKAGKAPGAASPMTSASMWVDAIRIGRQLLQATGSVTNATALLKALDG